MSTKVRQRIAEINGVGRRMLVEASSVPQMITTIRGLRTEVLGIKQFREGPSNDALAAAVNGMSDAIMGLEEYLSTKDK